MNNFDLYQLLNLVVNKDVYANAMSDSEFQLQLQAKNIAKFMDELPTRKSIDGQSAGAGVTRMTQHNLSPFIIDDDFTITSGVANVSGLYYLENFWSATSKTSEIISFQEAASRIKSYIKPPTTTDLVAYPVDGGLKILNVVSGTIHVLGYRLPTTPTFIVTTNETTLEMEYLSSVELEWNDGCKLDILYMILQEMGVTIERNEVSQLANKLIVTGR